MYFSLEFIQYLLDRFLFGDQVFRFFDNFLLLLLKFLGIILPKQKFFEFLFLLRVKIPKQEKILRFLLNFIFRQLIVFNLVHQVKNMMDFDLFLLKPVEWKLPEPRILLKIHQINPWVVFTFVVPNFKEFILSTRDNRFWVKN